MRIGVISDSIINILRYYRTRVNLFKKRQFIFLVRPQIAPFDFGSELINKGDFVSTQCSVHKGDLPINISWLHNNISIGYKEGIMITNAGKKVSTMTIDSVDESHIGTFTCVAENKAGMARFSVVLNVNGNITYSCSFFCCINFILYFLCPYFHLL